MPSAPGKREFVTCYRCGGSQLQDITLITHEQTKFLCTHCSATFFANVPKVSDMPDRSGRLCFCGGEGVQIVADKWVCHSHANGQRTNITCGACGRGKLVVRWPVKNNHRLVTCDWCAAKSTMAETALADAVAWAKIEEQKLEQKRAEEKIAAAALAEQRREQQRIAKELADAAEAESKRLRLLSEQARINAELEAFNLRTQVVESKGRHVEVPDDE